MGSKLEKESCLLILFIIFPLALLILCLRANRPPIGYLHSWNQITTLATARDLVEGKTTLLHPTDVVTRVMWVNKDGEAIDNIRERYTIYEEFPLYHFLTAKLSLFAPSIEIASHTLTIFFWIIFLISLYLLILPIDKQAALIATALALTSFPILYYGQACMSDMAMLSLYSLFLLFLDKWKKSGQNSLLVLAAVFLTVSSLMKSYSILFAPLIILCFFGQPANRGSTLKKLSCGILTALLTALPVLTWHYYASFQPGQQEIWSHSLSAKITSLSDWKFYITLWKMFFRYLGRIPAFILLALVVRSTYMRVDIKRVFPWWAFPSFILLLVYLCSTADKVIYHDYYFLLCAPTLFGVSGIYLSYEIKLTKRPVSTKSGMCLLILLLAAHITLSTMKFLKATRINEDVLLCAEDVQKLTPKDSFIATLTDISRYNAIAFYSKRLAINVEGSDFPLSRYLRYGAKYLILNLKDSSYDALSQWVKKEKSVKHELLSRSMLKDFKHRKRICEIYSLEPRTSSTPARSTATVTPRRPAL